jgi:hypothetical protein
LGKKVHATRTDAHTSEGDGIARAYAGVVLCSIIATLIVILGWACIQAGWLAEPLKIIWALIGPVDSRNSYLEVFLLMFARHGGSYMLCTGRWMRV